MSEEEFVACMPNPDECGGTGGCMGATMELAFQFAMDKGLVSEWTAPYTSYFGEDDIIRYEDVYARGQGAKG